jgi:hypothetical protein
VTKGGDVFLMLKLSALTCLFYFGITLLIEIALIAVLRIWGAVGFALKPAPWAIMFAIIWLISFALAWRITYSQYLARVQELKATSSISINH